MGSSRSTRSKDKSKEYKAKGMRELHKARNFEKWVKKFVSQAKAGKIRTKRPITENGKLAWEKITTDQWTFGPFGKVVDGKFKENIPNWMTSVIQKYKEHYKKDHTPKKSKIRTGTKETLEEVRKSASMFQQAKSFKKRSGTGVGPSKQKD